ncbi:helix-turn-helix domain-containing protein [Clostridium chromiireducens]|uniref:Helix-turn-helix domain-containing protein n=1 Tax=Clostridium chromiireducens TaxID=225345 RepID=A0A964RSC9_9CLOT|nr:helix-turn-helix transcriptional regulator [Clostridium chromiireducens]MVX66930.1 helix-turn-helix domain-containing protein [Clostridium chromiireducens]
MEKDIIGKRIKELREFNKLTQAELAKKLGLSRPAITKYERGERIPDFYTILSLSDIFCVDVDYLVGKTNFKNFEERELSELKDLLYDSYKTKIISQTGIMSYLSETIHMTLNDSIANDNYEMLKSIYIFYDLIESLFYTLKRNLRFKENNTSTNEDFSNYTEENTKEIIQQIKDTFSSEIDYLLKNYSSIYHNNNNEINEISPIDVFSYKTFEKFRSEKNQK